MHNYRRRTAALKRRTSRKLKLFVTAGEPLRAKLGCGKADERTTFRKRVSR